MKLTILTPTYNRGYILDRLYMSLLNQTDNDFEWLIVDDGSTDDTLNIVESFKKDNKLKIRYIRQENGGKHRALNTGIREIESDLIFIVDSDDYLLPEAVHEISRIHQEFGYDKSICGYSFLRCFPNLNINGSKFKTSPYISDYVSCRINEGVDGDKAEVYKTSVLKKYPFLEVPNENFLFEDYVWIQMANSYKTVHVNISIYVGDYLEDGLTKNIDKKKISNPIGMVERANIIGKSNANLIFKIKAMIMLIVYGLVAKLSFFKILDKSFNKFLCILLYVPSQMYFKFKVEGER
ncbi:Glycosyl transferases involved in cell wall biogenesis [Streptococcus infantarius subsp. infantarius]|uniref:glycosyltransferase family 2 protein n=1 Tax=Streptococcus parasuis TaxID=1501662 RepID=UPI00208EB9B7|nr:Glycosyl transferases involved in cell wall biogenesis [Streptococcus infantarius subsp. infantarius]